MNPDSSSRSSWTHERDTANKNGQCTTTIRIGASARPRALSPDICACTWAADKQVQKARQAKRRRALEAEINKKNALIQRGLRLNLGDGGFKMNSYEDFGFDIGFPLNDAMVPREIASRTSLEFQKIELTPADLESIYIDDILLIRDDDENQQRKLKLYERNCQNISNLSQQEFEHHFSDIKGEIKLIFDCEEDSERRKIFLEGTSARLSAMCVLHPFRGDQAYTLLKLLFAFLIKPESREKYAHFFKMVLVPESLIRIYARVNKLTNPEAESELLFRDYYHGPVHENEKDDP